MNNNQNNGSTIVLLLIIMMISSMMSSSGALLGFGLFTSIKPSGNVKGYINQKDARLNQLSKETGVDGIALKNDIIEQTKKAQVGNVRKVRNPCRMVVVFLKTPRLNHHWV
jgi:hypothetical protein